MLNFIDENTPAGELTSRLFDGTAWESGKLPIPGSPVSAIHETASNGGEVLMHYANQSATGSVSTTWLRELAP